jgi:hypothetical protein
MNSLADNDAVIIHQRRSHVRIRRRQPNAPLRQFQRPSQMLLPGFKESFHALKKCKISDFRI